MKFSDSESKPVLGPLDISSMHIVNRALDIYETACAAGRNPGFQLFDAILKDIIGSIKENFEIIEG